MRRMGINVKDIVEMFGKNNEHNGGKERKKIAHPIVSNAFDISIKWKENKRISNKHFYSIDIVGLFA